MMMINFKNIIKMKKIKVLKINKKVILLKKINRKLKKKKRRLKKLILIKKINESAFFVFIFYIFLVCFF
jgi:hypothetical protein